MRLNLMTPRADLVSPEIYNRLFTMHGIIMVWFFLIPSIPATLGNFVMPLMIGARDLAFPRLNLAELVPVHGRRRLALAALALGGVDTGWTFYTPYSTLSTRHGYVMLAVLSASSSPASPRSSPASISSSRCTSCARRE